MMKLKTQVSTIAAVLLISGCATTTDSKLVEMQNELDQARAQKIELEAKANKSNAELQQLAVLNSQLQAANTSGTPANDLMPPNAVAGECYARILTPATYRIDQQEMIKTEAGYSLQVTEPEYEWTTESVLIKEASETAELVPARYEWRTETVLVKDAHEHLKTIPAVYENKSEKVLAKAAYTTWKKGRGPIEKLNNSTGEIMCLVEVPAEYKTVTSRVLVTPARTEKTTHPAEYQDIKKRVMVEGPTMVKKVIPAEYKTVKVKRVVKPAQETRVEIPATYQTVTNKVKVTDSHLEWRTILCETNTTPDIIRNLQRALLAAGHNPGAIDGVIGSDTMAAVASYQKEKNLAVGQITINTLKSLGINYK